MDIREAYGLVQENALVLNILKHSPKAAAAWPDYQELRANGYNHAEAMTKSGLSAGLGLAAGIAGGKLGGLAGTGVAGPKGGLVGGVGTGIYSAAKAEELFGDYYDKQNKKGKYSPEARQKRTSDNREFLGIHMNPETGKYEYNPDKAGDDIDNPLYQWTDKEREEYADKLNKAEADAAKKREFGDTVPGQRTNEIGQVSDKPSEGDRSTWPGGKPDPLEDIFNEPYTADQNIPENQPGDVTKPEDVKKPEDKEGKPEQKPEQKPGTDKEGDKNLTPMQQWAKNYPALAAKVKPGQAGYDEIQALKKPQGGATQSSVQQRAQQLQKLRTGKAETPVATAASLYQKPEEKLGNANNPMATPRPGGLMSKLQDYQNEHGYGDNKASAQQNDSSRFSRAPQQPQQARPMPQYGSPGMSNTERQARRGAEAVVDTVTDTVQGTGNALKRAAGSQPVQKVKDAAADVGRSAAVQTVKNQGQKALGALNNKRKEWTKPLGQ